MKIVLQRVTSASVSVNGAITGSTDLGLLVLVGVGKDSTAEDARWLATKTEALRVFTDNDGKMNLSVQDVNGGVLAISQFTLYGDAQKGRRPSFKAAANPELGRELYETYCDALTVPVGRGVFGADMHINASLSGPVTLSLESTGRGA